MCGRASLTASPAEIEEAFGLEAAPAVAARYNIAPSEPILTVRAQGGKREAALVRWGLVRSGSEDAKSPINLRAESAARGAMRNTLRDGRCIVPLTGFYEWTKLGKLRQPWNVRRKDGGLFGVAGLWARLESGAQEPLESCLVLTTAANEVVKPIHERMPLILDPSAYERWLEPSPLEADALLKHVATLPGELLEAYSVSRLVNRAGVEDPRCLEPAAPAWP
jgi:putative SOS response-associated peptidase YedK